MASRPARISQKELTAYAKATQTAGIAAWTVEATAPDGSFIKITAGGAAAPAKGSSIDKRLGITNGQ